MKAKRILKISSLAVLTMFGLAVLYLFFFPVGQQPDRDFDVSIRQPAFQQSHPTVLFDEAHFNAATTDKLYAPFVRLISNDGYTVVPNDKPFSSNLLEGKDILVIVDAAGGSNPQLFGLNIPILRTGTRDSSAFDDAEIIAVRDWVQKGGSLLLIADHWPFGGAASKLGRTFGIDMHGGFTEVSKQFPEQPEPTTVVYTRENGLLADHPITRGRNAYEVVYQVTIFTGQSFDAPTATPLLSLPDSAIDYLPPPPTFESGRPGAFQGCTIQFGQGRIVVLADAAELSAQVSPSGERFGMSSPGTSNRQFALNIMHWLSRLL